jgi:hypothetical protein
MRHFFDMTGNGQRAKRRLRAALSEKLWDICAQNGIEKYVTKTKEKSKFFTSSHF